MKCDICGRDDKNSKDWTHVCVPVDETFEEFDRFEEFMAEKNPAAIPTDQSKQSQLKPVDVFVVIPDNEVLQTKELP